MGGSWRRWHVPRFGVSLRVPHRGAAAGAGGQCSRGGGGGGGAAAKDSVFWRRRGPAASPSACIAHQLQHRRLDACQRRQQPLFCRLLPGSQPLFSSLVPPSAMPSHPLGSRSQLLLVCATHPYTLTPAPLPSTPAHRQATSWQMSWHSSARCLRRVDAWSRQRRQRNSAGVRMKKTVGPSAPAAPVW